MPEASKSATLLIAVSYQALKRSENHTLAGAEPCDNIVIVLFAGFYIESYLNLIIEKMGKGGELKDFWGSNPGLLKKFSWFYNSYFAEKKIDKENRKQLFTQMKNLYPELDEILQIRNDICHGRLEKLLCFEEATRLRIFSKRLVDILVKKTKELGYELERNILYRDAIPNNVVNHVSKDSSS
jgi:hypothetical protein